VRSVQLTVDGVPMSATDAVKHLDVTLDVIQEPRQRRRTQLFLPKSTTCWLYSSRRHAQCVHAVLSSLDHCNAILYSCGYSLATGARRRTVVELTIEILSKHCRQQ